jgi:hypothetical protein
MTTIPKALVHVTSSFAVEPTEQQLLDFYKDYGYDTIDEILEGHGGGYWGEVIREWFVNTYQVEDRNEFCKKNNILKYESDSEEEQVVIIDEDKWNALKENDLIY